MKGDELICLLRRRDDLCDNEKERWVCERKRMQKLMLYREQDSTQDTTLQDMWHNTTRLTTFCHLWHNTTRLGQTRDKQNKIQETRDTTEEHTHTFLRQDSSHSSTLMTEEYKRLDDKTWTLHSASHEHSTLHQKNNNHHHKNKNSLNIQEQYNFIKTRTRTLQEHRRTCNLNMKQNTQPNLEQVIYELLLEWFFIVSKRFIFS